MPWLRRRWQRRRSMCRSVPSGLYLADRCWPLHLRPFLFGPPYAFVTFRLGSCVLYSSRAHQHRPARVTARLTDAPRAVCSTPSAELLHAPTDPLLLHPSSFPPLPVRCAPSLNRAGQTSSWSARPQRRWSTTSRLPLLRATRTCAKTSHESLTWPAPAAWRRSRRRRSVCTARAGCRSTTRSWWPPCEPRGQRRSAFGRAGSSTRGPTSRSSSRRSSGSSINPWPPSARKA